MPIKLLVTGATGTAGSEVVRQALLHPSISQVTVLVRRPLPGHIAPSPPNAKLTTIIHSDYLSYPPSLLDQGISSLGWKEADYEVLTKDYPLAAAKAFAGARKEGDGKLVFCYLSGEGSDQDKPVSAMFGRVKGRAEAALAALPTSSPTLPIAPYSFRPAGIAPIHPTPDAPAIYRYLNWLFPVVGALLPTAIIKTDVLARGMLEVALKGSSGAVPGWEGKGQPGNKGVFDSEEIKKLAKGSVLEGK